MKPITKQQKQQALQNMLDVAKANQDMFAGLNKLSLDAVIKGLEDETQRQRPGT